MTKHVDRLSAATEAQRERALSRFALIQPFLAEIGNSIDRIVRLFLLSTGTFPCYTQHTQLERDETI
jgi:hypothetical protein